ncbi:MAG: hypothetical protein MI924_36520 [Chloroflexales bacterium]|nr:hypothetical protein [Chloroflexales bacterium]
MLVIRRWLPLLLVLLAIVLVAPLAQPIFAQPGADRGQLQRFEFALIGDLPYDAEQERKFDNLIADINNNRILFTVHDGDFKSGSSPCSDEMFSQRYELFQTFKNPFIFVFGDNEWIDCHRVAAGGYAPLERLDKLREIFTADDSSLGQRALPLERQSKNPEYATFRENVRWVIGEVMFVGLHVVGSNNNLGRTPEADAEYYERNAANLAWMRDSFVLATEQDMRAVMLIIQANPNFERRNDPGSGFKDFIDALERETLAFKKPVVLVHGDSHYFRIDKPLLGSASNRRIENLTRVETFGSPDVHWLRATVDPHDPNVFTFRQEIVEANLVEH